MKFGVLRVYSSMASAVFVGPACGEWDIVVTIPGQCMCMRECPDLSRPLLLHLCMDFKIIWHSCPT